MAMVPIMTQYMAKYINFPFFTILIIHRQAAKPATKADKNPANKTLAVIPSEIEGSSTKSKSFSKEPPNMGSRTIRNENLAALSLSMPINKAVEIVAPERDIPGNMATVWANPIIMALGKVTFPCLIGA